MTRLAVGVVTSVVLALLAPRCLQAQGRATIVGTVQGRRGAAVAGAGIAFEPGALVTRSDRLGSFRLEVAAGIAGRLIVEADRFAPDTVTIEALAAGSARALTVALAPVAQLSEVRVPAPAPVPRPLLDRSSGTVGGAIDSLELARLPTDRRDALSLAFTIPGVAQAIGFFDTAAPLTINGANSLYTQYNLDGLDNTEAVLGGPWVDLPLAAIARLDVAANNYGAELGRSSNGVVDYVSKRGGDSWHGELFAEGRPGGGFDSRLPAGVSLSSGAINRRLQLGAAAGGPLAARSRVFGAADLSRESLDQPIVTAYGNGQGGQRRTFVKLFGRLDQRWSESQSTTLTAALTAREFSGRGGGQTVPSADFTQHKNGALVSLTHTSRLSDAAHNTLSAQLGFFHWYYPPTASTFATPQVEILAPDLAAVRAVTGASGFQYDHTERQINLKDVVERRWGGHTVQAGADLLHGWFTLLGAGSSPSGSYVVIDSGNVIRQSGAFVSVADIPADIPVQSYTIDAAQQRVQSTQTVIGAFVQDRWLVSPSVTLNLGLRWDYDDLTGKGLSTPDLNNVQPRMSINWRPDARSVVRGGAGVYSGKLLYTIWSDALQFSANGPEIVTFSGTDAPAFGRGPTPAQITAAKATLPPREIREPFPLKLQSPTSYQLSLGFQRELAPSWGGSVDGVYSYTRHLPRIYDRNALDRPLTPADTVHQPPSYGDQFRPIPPLPGGFRQELTTQTAGKARYWGLFTTVRHAFSGSWSADLTWVWSRSRNDAEDINFGATQGNNFALEYADATNDRRHTVTLRTFYTVLERLRLAAIADFQTGTPINRIAGIGIDLDGSGGPSGNGFTGNYDRYAGVPRNGERLPGSFELSTSAAYTLPVARGNVQLRADVFNIFNRVNESGFASGIAGGGPRIQPGRPGSAVSYTVAGRPRQVQLSLQYDF